MLGLFVTLLMLVGTGAVIQSPPTALTSFEFLRSECLENKFNDHSTNSFIGNLYKSNSNSLCLNSNGISGFQVESVKNMTELSKAFSDSALSFELWVQPQLQNLNSMIMGFSSEFYTSLQCQFDVLISQGFFQASSNSTEFIIQLCHNGATTGNVFTSGPMAIDVIRGEASLVHLSFAVQFSSTAIGPLSAFTAGCQIFVNRVAAPASFFISSSRFVPSLWTKESNAIFNPSSAGDDTSTWSGAIFSFAVYNEFVSDNEILEQYYSTLANSIPTVQSQLVTVQQNGEVGDHANDPYFYGNPIANSDLQIIVLNCYDFDDQSISPLYNVTVGPTMKVYVDQVPRNGTGTLYFLNGSEITPPLSDSYRIQIPFDANSSSYSLRFRPPFDVYSSHGEMIANFSFYAIDGITGLSSADVAWVSVNVSHVDRPPVAEEIFSSNIIAERLVSLELLGRGYALDQDSIIVAAEVVDCPANGYLFSNGDSILRNCSGTTSGYISVSYPFVGYKYTGSQSVLWNSTVVGSDKFTFVLIDTEGRRSIPSTYCVSVNTALLAVASQVSSVIPSAIQEQTANISVRGADKADVPRSLMVRLTRTPTFGKLLTQQGTSVHVGDSLSGVIVAGSYDVGINANYIGSEFFFNVPDSAWNGTTLPSPMDSFDFVVYSESGAVSAPVTQYVTVLNVNDPTDLGYKRNADGYLSVYQYGVSSSSDSVVVLEGFSLLEFDKNVDVIRAHVSTTNGGELTLNSDYLPLVDFSSGYYCFADGGVDCVGDGIRNDRMIFVGTPLSIELVLNGMTYQNKKSVVDYINVTVYDGVGGECFLPSQPTSDSIFTGCFVSSLSIEVRVLDASKSLSNTTSGGSIDIRLYYIAFGLMLTIAIAICRCCWVRPRNKAPQDSPAKPKPAVSSKAKSVERISDFESDSPNEEKTAASINVRAPRDLDTDVWTMHINKNGKIYYYNSKTKESTWSRPDSYSMCSL